MTGDRVTSFTPDSDEDVPQFAPNFTVYLLPSDVVCLYSEDRKFFLHGKLYCDLVAAIGKGGKTFRQLVSLLAQDFPSDKIHEALQRLLDRRFIVRASRSTAGVTAAYWASLGLSPDIAEDNLRNCRVRIQSIDARSAAELSSALTELGVRVLKQSADLTVTLVNDYLDPRLAKLNRQHLSDRTPWLLAQPAGIFPLVGPIFTPGKSACWACLAERMKRNREVKALLDRTSARRIAVSPLAGNMLGRSGIDLAGHRNRESDRDRFSHRIERSHRQPRSHGLDHRQALRSGPSAMSGVWPKAVKRPAPARGADRAWTWHQTVDDERRLSDRFVAGNDRAFPQAR